MSQKILIFVFSMFREPGRRFDSRRPSEALTMVGAYSLARIDIPVRVTLKTMYRWVPLYPNTVN